MDKLIKYAVAATFWTGCSFSIIWGLSYWGVNPYLANFVGYSVGLVISFTVQKFFIFKDSQTKIQKQGVLFLTNFVIAYLANILTLKVALSLGIVVYFAHVIGGVVYTLTFYSISRYVVFK